MLGMNRWVRGNGGPPVNLVRDQDASFGFRQDFAYLHGGNSCSIQLGNPIVAMRLDGHQQSPRSLGIEEESLNFIGYALVILHDAFGEFPIVLESGWNVA